jgi:hypothetical protein
MYTRDQLDKIAEQMALNTLVERGVDSAMNKIAEGYIALGKLALGQAQVPVTEKIASGELTDNHLIEVGKQACEELCAQYQDQAWEEEDKEAHDLYYAAVERGYQEKLAECGVTDLVNSLQKVAFWNPMAILQKLQGFVGSGHASGPAADSARQLISLLQSNPEKAKELIEQNPDLQEALGV